MEIRIQAIHFEATDKLQDFIQKKVAKLEKFSDEIRKVEVSLKVVKPETAMNKEVGIQIPLPGNEIRAEKIGNSFEEAVDECCDILARQLSKYKEKQKNH